MSTEHRQRLRHWEKRVGRLGLAVLILAAALSFLAPSAAAPAWRWAVFGCLPFAAGSLLFLQIHQITGGQWGIGLRPFLAAGARLLPWIWPLAAITLLVPAGHPRLAELGADAMAPPAALSIGLRSLAYEIIFIGVAWAARQPWNRRVAGGSFVVLVFTLHGAAADGFFTLDPGWATTAFPLVWMSVQALSGLALAIVIGIGLGLRPEVVGPAGRKVGMDWGDLLLTAVVFSTYVAFMQFLIIWSGDMPHEISWYLRRSRGIWLGLAPALLIFHLAIPFLVLLQRRLKGQSRALARLAAGLCGAELLWSVWFILPPFTQRGPWLPVLAVACFLGAAGLFLNRYLAGINPEEIES